MSETFPLHWPEGWTRTKFPGDSQLKTTLPRALDNVDSELRRFAKDSGKKIDGLVISSNYSLSDRNPKSGGVAVYFTWDGLQTCIAVDRYHKIEDNLQAIFRCLEAERTKLRHGGLNLVRAAFRGYAALPPPDKIKPWRGVLKCEGFLLNTIEEAENAYRQLAKERHPDVGGSPEMMADLNGAIKEARKELAS